MTPFISHLLPAMSRRMHARLCVRVSLLALSAHAMYSDCLRKATLDATSTRLTGILHLMDRLRHDVSHAYRIAI